VSGPYRRCGHAHNPDPTRVGGVSRVAHPTKNPRKTGGGRGTLDGTLPGGWGRAGVRGGRRHHRDDPPRDRRGASVSNPEPSGFDRGRTFRARRRRCRGNGQRRTVAPPNTLPRDGQLPRHRHRPASPITGHCATASTPPSSTVSPTWRSSPAAGPVPTRWRRATRRPVVWRSSSTDDTADAADCPSARPVPRGYWPGGSPHTLGRESTA
jgi:hypothetical protein